MLGGEAGLAWAHFIPSHKAELLGSQLIPRERRVSLTFRQMLFLESTV